MTQSNVKKATDGHYEAIKSKFGYCRDCVSHIQIDFVKADQMNWRLFEYFAHGKEPSVQVLSEILFDYMRRIDKGLDELKNELDSFYNSMDELNATNEKEQATNTDQSKWDCSSSTTLL